MDNCTPIRILIVDKHKTIRRTIGLFLGQYEYIDLVGEASDAEEALAACERTHPDIVLIDIVLSGTHGAKAMKDIRRVYPNIHLIGMTGMEPGRSQTDALDAGADNVIYKGLLHDVLLNAIDEVMCVHTSFSPTHVEVI